MRQTGQISSITVRGALILVVLAGCADRPPPERTVERFLRAINEKDVNVLVSCVDPRQERMFRGALRIIESVSGVPIDAVFEMFPGLHQALGNQTAEDFGFAGLRVVQRERTGDIARIKVALKAWTRSRGVVTAQPQVIVFELQQFEEQGWRIVAVKPSPP